MYKFLMADDEELVRRGFQEKIDWTGEGFEFLPPCENGRIAIEAIERWHPDVVMTDIYMPIMDGLAVSSWVAERYPETLVVVLSGYDEFEYAQAAIRAKVFDYVLKPVGSRDLKALLGRMKATLDERRAKQATEHVLQEEAEKSRALQRERLLRDLANGFGPILSREDFEQLFGFDPSRYACSVFIAALDTPEDQIAADHQTNLLDRLTALVGTENRILTFPPGDGRAAAIVFEQTEEKCVRVAEFFAARLIGSEGPKSSVGLGRAYRSWLDSSRSFDEAVASLFYRLVSGGGKAYAYTQTRETDMVSVAGLDAHVERLRLIMKSGDLAAAEGVIEGFIRAIEAAKLSPQRVRHEIQAGFAASMDALGEIGISYPAVSQELDSDFYRLTEKMRTDSDVRATLMKVCRYAAGIISSRSIHIPERKILDFKDHISRHFSEQNMSIQRVADDLSVSSSYLGKLIRRYLGASFVDYLTDFRVERAKELLAATDKLTYEIAEATGYPDQRYFSSIFRKRVGMTPSEYRSSRRAGNGAEGK
jgi:two-component system, response regulator YesN